MVGVRAPSVALESKNLCGCACEEILNPAENKLAVEDSLVGIRVVAGAQVV
jgi:hypothetical protein